MKPDRIRPHYLGNSSITKRSFMLSTSRAFFKTCAKSRLVVGGMLSKSFNKDFPNYYHGFDSKRSETFSNKVMKSENTYKAPQNFWSSLAFQCVGHFNHFLQFFNGVSQLWDHFFFQDFSRKRKALLNITTSSYVMVSIIRTSRRSLLRPKVLAFSVKL